MTQIMKSIFKRFIIATTIIIMLFVSFFFMRPQYEEQFAQGVILSGSDYFKIEKKLVTGGNRSFIIAKAHDPDPVVKLLANTILELNEVSDKGRIRQSRPASEGERSLGIKVHRFLLDRAASSDDLLKLCSILDESQRLTPAGFPSQDMLAGYIYDNFGTNLSNAIGMWLIKSKNCWLNWQRAGVYYYLLDHLNSTNIIAVIDYAAETDEPIFQKAGVEALRKFNDPSLQDKLAYIETRLKADNKALPEALEMLKRP